MFKKIGACGADEILKVIIYYMTCEKHAMVFLPAGGENFDDFEVFP